MNSLSFYFFVKIFPSLSYVKDKIATWLVIFFFQHIEYAIPLSPGL